MQSVDPSSDDLKGRHYSAPDFGTRILGGGCWGSQAELVQQQCDVAIRFWDRHGDLLLAAAEWDIETTRMGFSVRTRQNVFHDDETAVIARDIAQREALIQAIATDLRMSAWAR